MTTTKDCGKSGIAGFVRPQFAAPDAAFLRYSDPHPGIDHAGEWFEAGANRWMRWIVPRLPKPEKPH